MSELFIFSKEKKFVEWQLKLLKCFFYFQCILYHTGGINVENLDKYMLVTYYINFIGVVMSE